MSNATETKTSRRDWWVATNFLDKGGKKVAGPFGSRDLAMTHRTFLEAQEGHAAYFVDSEPLHVAA